MIYAVLDTNVLVSAHISRNPHAATIKVISFMLKGIITPIYNEEILSNTMKCSTALNFTLVKRLSKICLLISGDTAYTAMV